MADLSHSPDHGWRFSRQINLALIVTLILQAAMVLWWAGGAAERIAQLEADQARLTAILERTARMEAELADARETLKRIERRLDQQ